MQILLIVQHFDAPTQPPIKSKSMQLSPKSGIASSFSCCWGRCGDLRWRSGRSGYSHSNWRTCSSRVSGEICRKHLLKPACHRFCYLLNKLVFLRARQICTFRTVGIHSLHNQLTERLMSLTPQSIELLPRMLFSWVRQVKPHGDGFHAHHQSPAFRARRSLRQITPCAMYS